MLVHNSSYQYWVACRKRRMLLRAARRVTDRSEPPTMTPAVLRDVIWAISLKVILLGALYLCVIRPVERPRVDTHSTAAAVAGATEHATVGTAGEHHR